MKNEKMLLYVQTSDNPERQYSPLVLAQTAKAMELEPCDLLSRSRIAHFKTRSS